MSLIESLPPYGDLTSAEVRFLARIGRPYLKEKARILGVSEEELFARHLRLRMEEKEREVVQFDSLPVKLEPKE